MKKCRFTELGLDHKLFNVLDNTMQTKFKYVYKIIMTSRVKLLKHIIYNR